MAPGEATVSRPLRLPRTGFGLAQASHSSAGIWLTEDTASSVISDDAILGFGPVTRYDQPSRMVTAHKIVHCTKDFKSARGASGSREEPFKDHLIRVAACVLALLLGAYGPGQQRKTE